MKRISYLIFVGMFLIIINACKKNTDSATLDTKSASLSLGAVYANEIYYRLSDGLITSVPRNNWDIGFVVSPREAAILTNATSGVILKAYPVSAGWNWVDPVDTAGFYSWTNLYNSDTTWTEGAFNMNATGHPNYGWGVYDVNTHNLTGISLYIIKTRAGTYKKIWIMNKLSALQKYTFRYSDLDGSNENTISLDLAGSTKNFVYYSLDTDEEVDREPAKDQWDILFTKWIDKSINYPVTGVLQNIDVTAQESTDIDPMSKVFPSTGFLTNISTIGSDWKIINMQTYQYTIDETRVFFIKDPNGQVYRIKFKTFEGSTTGNLTFDVSILK
jgi:HmuY protein